MFLEDIFQIVVMDASRQTDNRAVIQEALNQLDDTMVLLNGKLVKPSQCYHASTNPFHVLYNTNCPEALKAKVEAILSKYRNQHEDHSAA